MQGFEFKNVVGFLATFRWASAENFTSKSDKIEIKQMKVVY